MAKKSLFSVTTIFASFFGAAMIAGAFAYFNYKFSEYKFINFRDWVFYSKTDIFKPKDDKYILVFYSSKMEANLDELVKAKTPYHILAIDYYQKNAKSTPNVTFLRSGTNTTLKFIQRFNIYKAPSIFIIKKSKENLYKQDSMIRELDTIKDFNNNFKSL